MNEYDALMQRADNLFAGAVAERGSTRKAILAFMAGEFYEDAIRVAPSDDVAPYMKFYKAHAYAKQFRAAIATEEPTDETLDSVVQQSDDAVTVMLIQAKMATLDVETFASDISKYLRTHAWRGSIPEKYQEELSSLVNVYVSSMKAAVRLHSIAQPYLSEGEGRAEREMQSDFNRMKTFMKSNDISEI